MSIVGFFWLIAGELTRHVYEGMRREASCMRIQRYLRMYLARKAYIELCSSAVSIQTGMLGMAARNELRFRQQTRAAILIQVSLAPSTSSEQVYVVFLIFRSLLQLFSFNKNSWWLTCVLQSHFREFLARSEYIKLKKATITTQCAWRVRVARKELRKLKMVLSIPRSQSFSLLLFSLVFCLWYLTSLKCLCFIWKYVDETCVVTWCQLLQSNHLSFIILFDDDWT